MIKQIAVFLENQSGKASACCKALKNAEVNLRALTIADTKEFGIVRIIADNHAKALTALKDAGFLATSVEVVAVEVPDTSGALAELLILLGEAGVSVEYMYSFAGEDNHAKIAFKTSSPDKAEAILKEAGAKVL